MQQILSRFDALVPEFGKRSFSLDDLHDQCSLDKIDVVEMEMALGHGLSWTDRGGDCTYVNRLITPSQRIIAGWHEYCHIQCHPTEARVLASLGPLANRTRWEVEANAVGIIALIPRVALQAPAIEIAHEYCVIQEVTDYRLQLFVNYGF
jgi:hypothetical protein